MYEDPADPSNDKIVSMNDNSPWKLVPFLTRFRIFNGGPWLSFPWAARSRPTSRTIISATFEAAGLLHWSSPTYLSLLPTRRSHWSSRHVF